jgi:hypothetical protein
MYETQGKEFASLGKAKKHVESLPYYAEAVSRDGLLQTVWDHNGEPVCARQIVVEGIGVNRTVSVGSWYNY